jgi:hypothetical protein
LRRPIAVWAPCSREKKKGLHPILPDRARSRHPRRPRRAQSPNQPPEPTRLAGRVRSHGPSPLTPTFSFEKTVCTLDGARLSSNVRQSVNSPEQVIQNSYADLVGHVFLTIRNGLITDREQLHDLADALHNVSCMLGTYGGWMEDRKYRELYLHYYDQQWGTRHLTLEAYLNERIAFHSKM